MHRPRFWQARRAVAVWYPLHAWLQLLPKGCETSAACQVLAAAAAVAGLGPCASWTLLQAIKAPLHPLW